MNGAGAFGRPHRFAFSTPSTVSDCTIIAPALADANHEHSMSPERPPRLSSAAAVIAALLVPSAAGAQIPGLPVLQNAFSNPGITVAANYGSGEGDRTIAAAAAWAPATGRFQFSAGVGSWTPDEGERTTAYGARFAAALFSFAGGSIGLAPFIGVGGAKIGDARVTNVPIGVGAGWRRALGSSRGISLHAAPFYSWTRATDGDETQGGGQVRVAAGVDVTIIRSLGATIGVEGGQKAKEGDPGVRGVVFGGGLSYAFR